MKWNELAKPLAIFLKVDFFALLNASELQRLACLPLLFAWHGSHSAFSSTEKSGRSEAMSKPIQRCHGLLQIKKIRFCGPPSLVAYILLMSGLCSAPRAPEARSSLLFRGTRSKATRLEFLQVVIDTACELLLWKHVENNQRSRVVHRQRFHVNNLLELMHQPLNQTKGSTAKDLQLYSIKRLYSMAYAKGPGRLNTWVQRLGQKDTTKWMGNYWNSNMQKTSVDSADIWEAYLSCWTWGKYVAFRSWATWSCLPRMSAWPDDTMAPGNQE